MKNPATCRPAITPYIAISLPRSWAVIVANDCRTSRPRPAGPDAFGGAFISVVLPWFCSRGGTGRAPARPWRVDSVVLASTVSLGRGRSRPGQPGPVPGSAGRIPGTGDQTGVPLGPALN